MIKKQSKFPTFKFNTDSGEISIDGNKINAVTELKIEAKGDEDFSTVTIKFDSNAEIEGSTLILPRYSLQKTINEAKEAIEEKNYISERIVNISEIETLIKNIRFLSNNLIDAISNKDYLRAEYLSSDINLKLHMLDKFEFEIEQRKINVNLENSHQF